jgi:hypothetical protein
MAYYLAQGSPAIGSGDEDVIFLAEGANWTNWVSGSFNGVGGCLIEGYEETSGTADVFLDEYLVTTPFFEITVTRQSLCVWYGVGEPNEFGTPDATIFYGGYATEGDFGPIRMNLKWNMLINTPGEGGSNYTKTNEQSSPVGTYDNDFNAINPTVAELDP